MVDSTGVRRAPALRQQLVDAAPGLAMRADHTQRLVQNEGQRRRRIERRAGDTVIRSGRSGSAATWADGSRQLHAVQGDSAAGDQVLTSRREP